MKTVSRSLSVALALALCRRYTPVPLPPHTPHHAHCSSPAQLPRAVCLLQRFHKTLAVLPLPPDRAPPFPSDRHAPRNSPLASSILPLVSVCPSTRWYPHPSPASRLQ